MAHLVHGIVFHLGHVRHRSHIAACIVAVAVVGNAYRSFVDPVVRSANAEASGIAANAGYVL